MLKAWATKPDGTQLHLIGLSEMNLVKLREGKPIMFPLRAFGINADGEIVIMYGTTEQTIIR